MQTTCGHEPLHAKGMCTPCYNAAWYAANPGRKAAYDAAWYASNRERKAAYYAAWYAAHRERQAAYREANRARRAATAAAWREANPERQRQHHNRRRARKAGTAIVDRLDKALPCGVCGTAIDHSLRWPDPMSPSIGHEPPLALQPAESITRYEHLRCNLAKGTKTDDELLERMAS